MDKNTVTAKTRQSENGIIQFKLVIRCEPGNAAAVMELIDFIKTKYCVTRVHKHPKREKDIYERVSLQGVWKATQLCGSNNAKT